MALLIGGLAELYFAWFKVSYLCDFSDLSDKMDKLYMDDCLGTRVRHAASGT